MEQKETRICTTCRKELPLNISNFNRTSTRKFKGFMYRCKKCSNGREKEGRYAQRSDYLKKYQKEATKNNPHKVRARYLARKAVKEGVISKFPCEVCGSTKSQGHHPDYDRPLEVRWLCSTHHQQVHSGALVLDTPNPQP